MDRPEERLALIELLERDGRVRRCIEVRGWPVTIGRALDCDIVLDDPHVAAHHARLEPAESDGALLLHVGATRNGVQVGPRTLCEGESCPVPPRGEVWQLGATRVRVRLPGDELEPEKPLGLAVTGARPWVTAACALGAWGLALIQNGIALDPGSSFTDWLVPLIGLPVALLLWCVLWAVGSKLFQHRFEFPAHFAVAVKGLVAIGLLDVLLPLLAFALSLEWLSRITPAVIAAVGVATLYAQARLVVPLSRRVLAAGIAACYAVGAAVLMTLNYQRTDRLFNELYMATLPPPALRLAGGAAPKAFVNEAATLKARLDARAAEDARPGPDSDDDD